MGKLFDLDSPLMQFLTRMADLMILNLVTLLFMVVPFTGGAALTGMHYVLLKMVRNEESYILKSFWKSFRENFKQSTILWIIICIVAVVLGMDYYMLYQMMDEFPRAYVIVLFAVTIFAYMTFMYIYPLQSKFVNTVPRTLKNSVMMMILGLPRTILMVVISIIPIILLYFFDIKIIPLLMLFGFSLPGYAMAFLYNGLFKRFEPAEEPELSEEEELNKAIRALDQDVETETNNQEN
ncbi:MAG: DUF624 domain-containing protein [Butyrivibrio sp.]|nr:DUF624 domain-containing protein [Butyrivibrio sp.]